MKRIDISTERLLERKLRRRRIKAIIMTVLLLIILYTVYLIPSEEGTRIVDAVESFIQRIAPDDSNIPSEIICDVDYSDGSIYFGKEYRIKISVSPLSASKDVTYSFDSDAIEFTGNDTFTVKTPQSEAIAVTAVSKLNPDVTSSFVIYTAGISPVYELLERTDIYLGSSYFDGTEQVLDVGKSYAIDARFVLNSEGQSLVRDEYKQDHYRTTSGVKFLWNGDSSLPFHLDQSNRAITFTGEEKGVLSMIFYKLESEGILYEESRIDIPVDVRANGLTYTPVSPLVVRSNDASFTKISDSEYETVWTLTYTSSMYISAEPVSGKNTIFTIEPVGDAENYIKIRGSNITAIKNYGSFAVDIVPILNPELKTRINISIYNEPPVGMTIMPLGVLSYSGSENKMIAVFDEVSPSYDKSVRWSIVSGGNIAEINSETGSINPKAVGHIRVRAESIAYPELTAECDAEIKLISDNRGIASKILGHLIPFVLLACLFFADLRYALKRRWLASPLSFVLSITVAASTEGLQYLLSPTRGGSSFDFLINSSGGLLGAVLASVICLLSMRSFKKNKPYSYSIYKNLIKK